MARLARGIMSSQGRWCVGQLVRVRRMHCRTIGRVVVRLTPTLVVLKDGTRWSRKTGRLYGMGPTADRIEPWGDAHKPGHRPS